MNQKIISTTWLHQHLNDENLIILDASPASTITGKSATDPNISIPKARYFNLKKDFVDPTSLFPNTVPSEQQFQTAARKLGIHQSSMIVVYDNLGIYTSPRVWWLFKVMGHENIAVLDGGLPAWIAAGHDTAIKNTEQTYDGGDFVANFQTKWLKTYQEVAENIDNQHFTIVDARSAGRFAGTAPEPRKHLKSGHIPNSVNIPYQEVLENGKYKSPSALQQIFNEKCKESEEIAFSCGSGLTACIVMLASEIAFKESRYLYDGSWTEWAEKRNLRVN